MTAQKGKDLLVKMHDGSTYVTVAGLRSRRIAFNAETVDVTHAESAGRWRELLDGAGIKRAGVSGRGLFKDAATYAAETEGATYRIEIGAAQAERGNGRPVRIEATGEVPAATAKKLAGRAFLVPSYLGDALVVKRETLVRKVEPVPPELAAEEPEPEAAPAIAEEVPASEPPPVPEAAVTEAP